jgi:CrcB protein
MKNVLLVFVGGGLGSAARFVVATWMLAAFGPAFPWGTLTVNVVGCFLLGIVVQVGLTTELLSADARLLLATGVMGGFTTYSTFNYETLGYIQEGNASMAALYVASTGVSCLVAGVLGVTVARWTFGG